MKKINYLLGILTFVVLMSSCSVGYYSTSHRNSTTMTPNLVKLELYSDDIIFIGEESIDIDYRNYLGAFQIIDKINGEQYNRRIIQKVYLNGTKDIRLSSKLNKATYKIIDKFPNADYYVISTKNIEIQKMIMGRIVKESATIKAYRFKN